MNPQERVRLLLAPQASESDIAGIAGLLNLDLRAIRPEGAFTYERIWCTPDGSTYLGYVEDRAIGVRYLSLLGPDAHRLADTMQGTVPVVSASAVREMFKSAQSSVDWVTAVYHAAAVSRETFDPELFSCFQQAMAHPHPDVRKSVLLAASYPGWTEFKPGLQNMRDHDPVEEVRKLAGITIDSLESFTWNSK